MPDVCRIRGTRTVGSGDRRPGPRSRPVLALPRRCRDPYPQRSSLHQLQRRECRLPAERVRRGGGDLGDGVGRRIPDRRDPHRVRRRRRCRPVAVAVVRRSASSPTSTRGSMPPARRGCARRTRWRNCSRIRSAPRTCSTDQPANWPHDGVRDRGVAELVLAPVGGASDDVSELTGRLAVDGDRDGAADDRPPFVDDRSRARADDIVAPVRHQVGAELHLANAASVRS